MSVEIKDLSVKYKNGTIALNHINMTIQNGIYGLLGENGAGKTTLMRVLTTIIRPSGGRVMINGLELKQENDRRIQKKIGYLPQELGLYPNLTVRETLEYIGGLAGISKSDCKRRIEKYLEKTSLTSHQRKKNRQLSGGMKRRVGLIQALLHDPEVLIIDEPTTGLDPEERIRIRNLLIDFSRNRTILFSTHVVEDLAATCNVLAILKKGTVAYEGSRDSLIRQTKDQVWLCTLKEEREVNEVAERYLIASKKYTEEGIEIKFLHRGMPDLPCQPQKPTLEDAYIAVMNR